MIAQVTPILVRPHPEQSEKWRPRFRHEAVVNVKAALLLPIYVECMESLGALSLAVVVMVGADQPVAIEQFHHLRVRVWSIGPIPDSVAVEVAHGHCRVAGKEGRVSLHAQHGQPDVHRSLLVVLLGPHCQKAEAVRAGDYYGQQMLEREIVRCIDLKPCARESDDGQPFESRPGSSRLPTSHVQTLHIT